METLKKCSVTYLLELCFRIVIDCDAFSKTVTNKELSIKIVRVNSAQDTDKTTKALKTTLEDYPDDDRIDYLLKQDILFKYKDGYELLVVPKPNN